MGCNGTNTKSIIAYYFLKHTCFMGNGMDLVLTDSELSLVLQLRAMDQRRQGNMAVIAAGYVRDYPKQTTLFLVTGDTAIVASN